MRVARLRLIDQEDVIGRERQASVLQLRPEAIERETLVSAGVPLELLSNASGHREGYDSAPLLVPDRGHGVGGDALASSGWPADRYQPCPAGRALKRYALGRVERATVFLLTLQLQLELHLVGRLRSVCLEQPVGCSFGSLLGGKRLQRCDPTVRALEELALSE
jgi:hypothetical protein